MAVPRAQIDSALLKKAAAYTYMGAHPDTPSPMHSHTHLKLLHKDTRSPLTLQVMKKQSALLYYVLEGENP